MFVCCTPPNFIMRSGAPCGQLHSRQPGLPGWPFPLPAELSCRCWCFNAGTCLCSVCMLRAPTQATAPARALHKHRHRYLKTPGLRSMISLLQRLLPAAGPHNAMSRPMALATTATPQHLPRQPAGACVMQDSHAPGVERTSLLLCAHAGLLLQHKHQRSTALMLCDWCASGFKDLLGQLPGACSSVLLLSLGLADCWHSLLLPPMLLSGGLLGWTNAHNEPHAKAALGPPCKHEQSQRKSAACRFVQTPGSHILPKGRTAVSLPESSVTFP